MQVVNGQRLYSEDDFHLFGLYERNTIMAALRKYHASMADAAFQFRKIGVNACADACATEAARARDLLDRASDADFALIPE